MTAVSMFWVTEFARLFSFKAVRTQRKLNQRSEVWCMKRLTLNNTSIPNGPIQKGNGGLAARGPRQLKLNLH